MTPRAPRLSALVGAALASASAAGCGEASDLACTATRGSCVRSLNAGTCEVNAPNCCAGLAHRCNAALGFTFTEADVGGCAPAPALRTICK